MNSVTAFTLQNVELVPPLGSRQPVPGTFVSLCPPGDFVWNAQHRIFESNTHDARIKVLHFRGQSFFQRKPRLEDLLIPDQEHVDWWERKERMHGQYPALELNFKKKTPTLLSSLPDITCHRVLAFGNEHSLILCTATYPASFKKTQEAVMLASMQSVQFHPSGIFGHFPTHARFRLDLQPLKLNWIPSKSADPNGPFLFRSEAQENVDGLQVIIELKDGFPESPGESLESLFQQNFFSSYQILEVQPIRVKQHEGFEAYAIETGHHQGNNRLEYVAILKVQTSHLTFHCIAPDDRISHLASFRQLLYSYEAV